MLTVDWARLAEIPVYGAQAEALASASVQGFPVLRKQDIARGFPHQWMTDAVKQAMDAKAVEYATSSGTTSDRLQILRPRDWWLDEYRRTYRHIPGLEDFRVGEDPKAILTTAVCSNTACFLDDPTMEQRIRYQTLYLNSTPDPNRWQAADIQRMVDELAAFAPVYLDADPIYLALFLAKAEQYCIPLRFPMPRLITLSYELVPGCCRAFIEARLPTAIRTLYGSTEAGYLYAEDDQGRLRRCPELSQVELLPVAAEQGLYQVVVSSFKNDFMPLLRYDLGDVVQISLSAVDVAARKEDDVLWANSVELAAFSGRLRDVMPLADGQVVCTGTVDQALAPWAALILLYQVMVSGNAISLQVIPATPGSIDATSEAGMAQALRALFADQADVTVTQVQALRPEHSGKFSLLKRG